MNKIPLLIAFTVFSLFLISNIDTPTAVVSGIILLIPCIYYWKLVLDYLNTKDRIMNRLTNDNNILKHNLILSQNSKQLLKEKLELKIKQFNSQREIIRIQDVMLAEYIVKNDKLNTIIKNNQGLLELELYSQSNN